MTSIKASVVAQAIKAAIVVTVTPSANGLSSRDVQFFRTLGNQITDYLANCDPVYEIGNQYKSKPPVWLPDDTHADYWVVRLLDIPLAQSQKRIIVDLRFADGTRGYTLQQVRFSSTLKVADWRSTPYVKVVPASTLTVKTLIECCFENIEQMLLDVYKGSSALQPKGTASIDEVVKGLEDYVSGWGNGRDAPDWEVHKAGSNRIEVSYTHTFRRNTFMDEWMQNSRLRNAGSSLSSVISEATRLNSKIKVVENKPLTKQAVQEIEDFKDRNGDSSYSEYEQSMGGHIIFQL
ncbi:hypothetical protein [Yersinia ruckeri]|uniref:hypothetical protein n=1 Tax=Yersinia ruckeri TaxID=29486 RepID=UPI002237447C|nr:hypothetical protein [Yersinia ruckeri]MCW6598855.1 hypothetical protein [Yersinia ruckeri]